MKNVLCFCFIMLLASYAYAQEQITISTYYPSPYGNYRELRAKQMAIGDTYSGANYCWPPEGCLNVVPNAVDLIVEGSVGIGQWNIGPYKLYVNGNMFVNGDILTDLPATYPDYVFETGYKMLPLGQLKGFIDKNKHLPNMPSSQEVKEKGVKIFAQNRLMLEKLEEAYLYITQLEERIAKLEKEIAK